MQTRIEHDTMGEVEVPNEALWELKHSAVCKTLKLDRNVCRVL